MSKVVGVVVTFNRMKMLGECVKALLNQTHPLEKLFIIDNASTDGTPAMIAALEREYTGRIEGIRLLHNMGGAGGFNYGMLAAALSDPGFIWLMDDDVEPRQDCLEQLLLAFEGQGDADMICPLVYGVHMKKLQGHHHKLIDKYLMDFEAPLTGEGNLSVLHANAFVGPLMRYSSLVKYGLPIAQYFIWADDMEYTFRIGSAGKLFLAKDAIMDHKDQYGKPVAWKAYYGFRNYMDFIRLNRRLSRCYPLSIGLLLSRAIRASVSITLRGDSENRARAYLALLGVVDGLRGHWNRTVR